jgi:predicted AlkP superfamily pyrophosphatase or phosphodiesterase
MLGRWCFVLLVVGFTTQVRAVEPQAQHVVIISVDGFPASLLDDPKAPIPNIRRLAQHGVVAAGMRTVNPTVTWPNHTTLVTGVRPESHGVLANGVLTRHGFDQPVTIEAKRDQSELIYSPTLFDLAAQKGFLTAAINWPCTRNSRTLGDNFPDVPEALTYTTPRLLDELRLSAALPQGIGDFVKETSAPQRDMIWTEATCSVIAERKPNLLLLHLLNVDSAHHALGPQTLGGYTAIAFADACVGRVLAALDEAAIGARTAVFVLADHGFTLTPKALKPNSLLRQNGFLQSGPSGKVDNARIYVVPEGGAALLYLLDPALTGAERARVRKLFEDRSEIEAVVEPKDFHKFGLPSPQANPQMADLVLFAKDGFGFSGKADGDEFVVEGESAGVSKGSHGFVASNSKMNALFVAAGAGLREGARLGVIDNVDVAPTAAALLGFELQEIDGHVLADALSNRPAK